MSVGPGWPKIAAMMRSPVDRHSAPPSFETAQERWAAVVRRDRDADGVFYYSVLTTAVYCKPSCAARRPRRENVGFHRSWMDAERAGFRPCRRCRPTEALLAVRHVSAIARACRLLQEEDERPGLNEMVAAAGMSPRHFHRVFKTITGLTPKAYVLGHRADRVRDQLARGTTSLRRSTGRASIPTGGSTQQPREYSA